MLARKIEQNSGSRALLDEIYDGLLNDVDPSVIDPKTLEQYNNLFKTLESFRMLSVKRDRVQFLYEQVMARAVSDSFASSEDGEGVDVAAVGTCVAALVGDPVAIATLAGAIASTAISAGSVYSSCSAIATEAEVRYLEENWALTDEESATLHECRTSAFNYMVEMVNSYNLPGKLALNETAIDELVSWMGNDNTVGKVRFLESNLETYRAFGTYWLVLAQARYENGDYAGCLDALDTYEGLSTGIFRQDTDYARVLPLAIAAAGQGLDEDGYLDRAQRYTDALIAESSNSDWSLRYFACQTLVDLYARTSDKAFLQRAYDEAVDSVNNLVGKQRELNASYLQPVAKTEVAKDATDAVKKEAESFNKYLDEQRKAALPPVYGPLLLNCDLLVGIVDELQPDDAKLAELDGILHLNGTAAFLVDAIDQRFWFASPAPEIPEREHPFNGKELHVSVREVSDYAAISTTVASGGNTATFTDWKIDKVERGSEGDVDTFTAIYTSEQAKKYAFNEDMSVEVSIEPYTQEGLEAISLTYATFNSKDQWWKNLMVWDSGIGFDEL